MSKAELIGLDWGSTSLRAMLIDARGQVLSERRSARGASTLAGGPAGPAAFAAALDELIADWAPLVLPMLACGMVGSQHGWREVPYADCPADAQALAAGALAVPWRGHALRLLPGLRCESAAGMPDLMRGEETQLLGALTLAPELGARSCVVMPGTHSKWARVVDGRLLCFATHLTGELYALLRQHSVLARLMPTGDFSDPSAFGAGVRAARERGEEGLSHQLFAVRTLGLGGRLAGSALPDYLSGLLIGHELRAGLAARDADAPLVLVGEPALCQRYASALALFDLAAPRLLPNTAALGLWRLSQSC